MTMFRYRTIGLSIACFLLSLPVLAQPVTDAPARTSVTAASPSEEELLPPELPQPPAALARRVAALTRVAEQTEECYSYQGERNEHTPDPRCDEWYATLMRGGDAAAYAIGEVLNRSNASHGGAVGYVRGNIAAEQRGPRLVQILAATGAAVAPVFLVRYVADTAISEDVFDETSTESLRQLARLAGHDAHPVAPWERGAYRTPEVRRDAARSWIRWWNRHQGSSIAERRTAGTERALADLAHADPAVRFAAMQQLVTVPLHRAIVVDAARTLLADENLPARAVTHIVRWARRHQVPVTPPTSPLMRVAR